MVNVPTLGESDRSGPDHTRRRLKRLEPRAVPSAFAGSGVTFARRTSIAFARLTRRPRAAGIRPGHLSLAAVRDALGVEETADDRRVHGEPGVEELVLDLPAAPSGTGARKPSARCIVCDWIPPTTASASKTGPPICPMRLDVEVSMKALGSPSPLPGARALNTRVNIPSRGNSGSGTEPLGKVNVFAFSS